MTVKSNLQGALDQLPSLRDVIQSHNLRAEKKFGQNFLLDQNITDKIVRLSGDLSPLHVIEIGPGPGGLTRSLLKAGTKQVTALEIDPRAIEALQGLITASGGRLDVLSQDALGSDVTALVPAPRAIVANLPYNVATPLLIGWLAQIRKNPESFESMTLMFQREVADRIVAKKNTKAYGRLSVLCQWLCDVKIVMDLPPQAFTPPPKVRSAVVRFIPKAADKSAPVFQTVETLTAAAFGQRRKMIRSSLKDYSAALEKSGFDENLRAENLAVTQFITLAKLIEA